MVSAARLRENREKVLIERLLGSQKSQDGDRERPDLAISGENPKIAPPWDFYLGILENAFKKFV